MAAPSRWDWLAGLRFALAGIVVCYHLAEHFPSVDQVTGLIAEFGGKAAVLGFFLVSGYSIAASLERGTDGFYTRRLIRIYPVYVVALIAALGLDIALHGQAQMPDGTVFHGSGILQAIGNFFFLQTFVVKPIEFNGLVWSLAVEVSYYLVSPLLLRLPKWFPLTVIALSALAYVAPRHDDWGVAYFVFHRFNMLLYAWSWFMGYALFFNRRLPMTLGFALLGCALVAYNDYLNPERFAVLTFLGSLTILSIAGTKFAQNIARRPEARSFVFLGNVSYPVYLFQFPIFISAAAIFGITNSLALHAWIFAGSVAVYFVVDVYLKDALVSAWRRNRRKLHPVSAA